MPPLWRWAAVFIHALRQACCPSPGLMASMVAAVSGDLTIDLNDAPRRRQMQGQSLPDLLGRWILG
jgi:hypothetical protein